MHDHQPNSRASEQPVRIGLIGCGGRSRAHVNALSRRPDVRIVAVADVVESAARATGEPLNAAVYTDHRALLAREDLDAVWLCIPVFAHGQVDIDVVERGLPFFVEKPVARELDVAQAVATRLKALGQWACVGYQLRYLPQTRQAKAFVRDRAPMLLEGRYWSSGRKARWGTDWEKAGGQLVEQATHTIDLMRHLAGDVVEVYSQQAKLLLHEITSPDVYTVNMRFQSGALGSLSTNWVYAQGDPNYSNVVHVGLDGCLLRLGRKAATVSPEGVAALPEANGPDIYGAFIEAVRTGDPTGVLTPYDEAVATLAVSLAANESARRNRPTAL